MPGTCIQWSFRLPTRVKECGHILAGAVEMERQFPLEGGGWLPAFLVKQVFVVGMGLVVTIVTIRQSLRPGECLSAIREQYHARQVEGSSVVESADLSSPILSGTRVRRLSWTAHAFAIAGKRTS